MMGAGPNGCHSKFCCSWALCPQPWDLGISLVADIAWKKKKEKKKKKERKKRKGNCQHRYVFKAMRLAGITKVVKPKERLF